MSRPRTEARGRGGQLNEKRWLAYSLAAGATGGFVADPVAATIHYTDISDISIPLGYYEYLNLNGDGYDDLRLVNLGGFGTYQGAYVPNAPGYLAAFQAFGGTYVKALDADDPIDAAAMSPYYAGIMAYGPDAYNAQFQYVTNKYIGFSFPSGAGLHYGWVRVDVDTFIGKLVIKDYAYEDQPDAGIAAGATTSSPMVPGDADGDGDVDLDDFDILTDNYDMVIGGGASVGDFDDDGDVDFDDFVIQALNMPFGDPDEAVSELPEPGMLGFLAAGAGGLMYFRRKREQDR